MLLEGEGREEAVPNTAERFVELKKAASLWCSQIFMTQVAQQGTRYSSANLLQFLFEI